MIDNLTVNKTTVPLAQLFEPIGPDLARVEAEFSRQLESGVALIPEIGRYIQQSGGKRVRPGVLLLASRMCGYQGRDGALYASVVEFIHAATLVHDDIVDHSDFRRGRRAVHSRWGEDVTVLLGDYLYIKAMDTALRQDALDILRTLSDATLRMIEGELYQLTKNGDAGITEAEHLVIVERKTAGLFGACAEIGGLLGGASLEQRRALRWYGLNLGMTFQLVDDLLDLTGDQATMGKPVGSDLREGKLTLPVIYLLQRADGAARALVADVLRTQEITADGWLTLSGLLREHGALESAQTKSLEFAEAARASLSIFPASPERDALAALPDYILARDR